MNRLVLLLFLFIFPALRGQDTTYYGDQLFPVDTIRVLNFFININYDLCDTCDPCTTLTSNWIPGPPNSMNQNFPVYLDDFMDSDYNPNNIHGTFTKRYAEASFKNFIVLGDHVVVNINQSYVDPTGSKVVGYTELLNSCVSLINQLGGLQTKNGHESISDYDGSYTLYNYLLKFQQKPRSHFNDQIDFIQVYFRNSTKQFGGLAGEGRARIKMDTALMINGLLCKNDAGTVQGQIKNQDLSNPAFTPADIHELAHNLLGMDNSAHMGGGGPLNSGALITLEANQGGWSILGGSTSSMISCNGFERWRLNWISQSNNGIPIAVNGVSSDLESPVDTTYYLRDFIKYGDAVRIKLPYVDAGALNQYIWLENHRLDTNNEDYPAYWQYDCKDDGVPGIYAYYQVGKDMREGTRSDHLYAFTDHLVPICADGNWDIELNSFENLNCVATGSVNIQHYFRENPLSGYHDLEEHFFNAISDSEINWYKHRHQFVIKLQNGQITNKLANMGDNGDPFEGITYMSIATNPAPFNVVTYHHKRPNYGDTSSTCVNLCKGQIKPVDSVNNRKIHLSGLRIDFTEQTGGIMKVDIRWDDYNVTKNVTWTGDIVLHESVNLISGKTITFDQNYTPNKHTRDAVTGVFAGPTYFRCLNNSSFVMQSSSSVILQNLSSFILESGSQLEINDGAVFTVKNGCTLQIKSGANFVVKGTGRIEVENGGYLCIEAGASGQLQDSLSVINLRNGSILGVNTDVISDPGTCVEDIAADIREYVSGPGKINLYIQNMNYLIDTYETGENIYVGYDVTDPPYGNVLINGAKVTLDANGEIIIQNGFEMDSGSELETK